MKWYYTIWKVKEDGQTDLLTEYGFIYLKWRAFYIVRRLFKEHLYEKYIIRKVSPYTDVCFEWTFQNHEEEDAII